MTYYEFFCQQVNELNLRNKKLKEKLSFIHINKKNPNFTQILNHYYNENNLMTDKLNKLEKCLDNFLICVINNGGNLDDEISEEEINNFNTNNN